jgi:hypothetical protein
MFGRNRPFYLDIVNFIRKSKRIRLIHAWGLVEKVVLGGKTLRVFEFLRPHPPSSSFLSHFMELYICPLFSELKKCQYMYGGEGLQKMFQK